jgi:predicted nucleic acid-binding protein
MRYFLDTNILVFILSNQKDEIDREVANLYNSTQSASAFMYLLWGEFYKLLPDSDLNRETPQGAGTYMSQ